MQQAQAEHSRGFGLTMSQPINKGLYCLMHDLNSGNGHDDCSIETLFRLLEWRLMQCCVHIQTCSPTCTDDHGYCLQASPPNGIFQVLLVHAPDR